jgi:hypothetical protein
MRIAETIGACFFAIFNRNLRECFYYITICSYSNIILIQGEFVKENAMIIQDIFMQSIPDL